MPILHIYSLLVNEQASALTRVKFPMETKLQHKYYLLRSPRKVLKKNSFIAEQSVPLFLKKKWLNGDLF